MGCMSSAPSVDGSNQLERQMLQRQLDSLVRMKVLLLGAGESGKSTVVKQLKYIHNDRSLRDPEEKKHVADALHENVVECMRALIHGADVVGIKLSDEFSETVRFIKAFGDQGTQRLTKADVASIRNLFYSDEMQQAFNQRHRFWLLEGVEYYIENADRFAEENFEPNEQDALLARVRTTGINETSFKHPRETVRAGEPKEYTFNVVDVGGQRNERKKWIHCFEDVKCILWVANLSGYNEVLFEDNERNRMDEALEEFRNIATNPLFKNTPVFLFLNKLDLLKAALKDTPLTAHYPDFKGEDGDVDAAVAFVKQKFQEVMPAGGKLTIITLTAIDREEVEAAFDAVKAKLLDWNRPEIESAVQRLSSLA